MAFSYGSRKPRCFLSYNNHPKGDARTLAEKYIVYGYASDPIQDRRQKMSGSEGIDIVPLDVLRKGMSAGY